ncbi:MAG: TIGR02452 family protein [Armatimonadota bacterium]|nr:TIGR02452 family protein [Armatimonadota bacterium]
MKRSERAALAAETLAILQAGHYTSPTGRQVSIASELRTSVAQSRLFRPADFPERLACARAEPAANFVVEVTPETSLQAAQRLAASGHVGEPLCLNFASAKNPGGGFRSGSQAQEESLARSSGLYACIAPLTEMYEHNRRLGTCLYSDHMIYSPSVPVFRDDEGRLLETPYLLSFVTAPAVNAGAVRKNEPRAISLIEPTMARRLRRVLWVASQAGHEALVLGAWGCGVFGSDPVLIARLFAQALGPGGDFAGCFSHVVYAVYDRSPGQEVYAAFQRECA